jgi:hypothetical protein
VKDLLSTGYFFEELKSYSGPKEMDLPTFSRGFAVPYLARKSESYQRSGQEYGNKILCLAARCLSDAVDDAMADSILGLKKMAASEVDVHEKALYRSDQFDKTELRSFRQKSEAAQSLGKLLVIIIRVFKLSEIITKRDKSEGPGDSIADVIKAQWELSVLAS